MYLVSYGIFRFLIEFLRDDERGAFIGNLSPSQFWSVLMHVTKMIYGIIILKKQCCGDMNYE